MLNEHLIDYYGLELPTVASYPDELVLDEALEELQIERRSETLDEKRKRLSIQERIDRWTLFGYTLVAAMSIVSSVIAMASSAIGILEIAFVMPLFTGPFMIHQRDGLIKCKKKREVIANVWLQTKRMKEANGDLKAEIDLLQREVERLRIIESKLKAIVEKQGHDLAVIQALFRESKQNITTKKQLAEAIGFENLMASILKTDIDGNHFIGEAELNLLAFRLESIDGVPFTGKEMIERFSYVETRSLVALVDVVRELYIEKRREQVSARERKELDRSPTKLGSHLLWKRRFEYNFGVTV